nr:IS3 family transposase [Rhizobium sp. Khangiran2]
MKRSRLTEEQIIGCLPQARHLGCNLLQLRREVWRCGCVRCAQAEGTGGRERQAEEAARRGHVGQCDPEGCRRKKMVKPDVKRDAVVHVCDQHGVSQHRTCEVVLVDRSSMRYRSRRPDDASIREAMMKVASERRRLGYRRIHVMLDRQGIVMNLRKLRRLYREEKLTVRKRGGRKRVLETKRPWRCRHARTSARACTSSAMPSLTARRFRGLAVVDDFTRECLCPVADTSLSGARLARELDSLITRREKPRTIVSTTARR